ncbi:Ubiquitin carboxyl-terminal hydrolase 30 [Gryllus bimaculatus]|nr:Ubiquitin carboxyl-terminal hydrolase 30 [Gryllus bimaculatus]
MDTEKIVIVIIVTVALGVGGFILWGPPDRCKRKAGRIGGLVNLGFTCFLNTLLQALASCPSMLEWLSQQEQVPGSLIQALRDVVLVLNGQHSTIFDDPYAPSDVIRSLVLKGWVISPGEQDAHELFHVIMTTLLEEAHSGRSQALSLSVALEGNTNEVHDKNILPRRIQSDRGDFISRRSSAYSTVSSCSSFPSFHPVSQAPPFQGFLTSQFQCMVCKYKSAVMYDTFDSLSLHLPSVGENIFMKKLTLHQLLNKFVSTEIVKDVTCEKCVGREDGKNVMKVCAMKTLNFGKLPKCLCIQIQRTIWQRNGQAYKRYDYVEFPEYLSMDEYTFMQAQKQKAITPEYFHNTGDGERTFIPKKYSPKHLYRLTGVIVHTGNLEAGHFITYRRAPIRDNNWYYTSDSEVRETSLKEVMQASAYMLFYNKCIQVISKS